MATIPSNIPPEVPRMNSRLAGWIGLVLTKLLRFRFEGEFPKEKKVMVALAPHTSLWDFIVSMPLLMAMRLKIHYLMKKEAFFFPFKRLFMALGGIPTDRSAPGGLAKQVANLYRDNEQMWIAIAPEGTRRKVTKWKNGFLRIAYAAKVPIVLIAWDFPSRRAVIDSTYYPTGDLEVDMREIQRRYAKYRGRNPEKQGYLPGVESEEGASSK
ncbi:1-acyl-sn-glycerol-3-phosphate acyltransferase [Biformimicrobium ophioploci]|uniref:Lysophospholipid acyltransferase family protein n=1 Tax=Biformimicrobium ophioploci TaxID=3036711 RepID=A0ABQ6LYF8_9GAMM|nr:1-acyl-sn-glycerol-3-phosphate acyltransferase [Microbulbifer sp. NKW57]GMG87138.1 lysophospholipid acyltransferase family protein [Microbulbifer sp. NKW57]